MKQVKFKVGMDMSVSWCWPPMNHPDSTWYTMTFRDSRMLDQACGGSPTHAEKLAKMEELCWEYCPEKANFIHVRSPKKVTA